LKKAEECEQSARIASVFAHKHRELHIGELFSLARLLKKSEGISFVMRNNGIIVVVDTSNKRKEMHSKSNLEEGDLEN
jgi:hypothetical protein